MYNNSVNNIKRITKTMSKAEEFLKEHYSESNDWKYYPPSEKRAAELMEAYHKQQINSISDEEIEKELEQWNLSKVFKKGFIRGFYFLKNKLLEQ